VGYFRAGRVPGYVQYIERDGTAGPVARDGTTAAQGYSGYIGRDGAGEGGQRAELFTREGQAMDREAFVNRGRGDPRAWTIIISPGSNDLDMARYVREFMLQMEFDLGRRLDWIAAVHRNTEFTHSHVLLRGQDREGHEFRMPRHYIAHGLRQRATEIATRARELGWVRMTLSLETPAHEASHLARLQRTLARWMASHAREGQER
jgi:type IV secretory pathway VirD2 relaxase